MILNPLSDRVVILADEPEGKSPGGILLPDVAKAKPQRGVVQRIGPGKLLENGALSPPSVKPGDRVLYTKYAGAEVEVDEVEYKILTENDILAIIN